MSIPAQAAPDSAFGPAIKGRTGRSPPEADHPEGLSVGESVRLSGGLQTLGHEPSHVPVADLADVGPQGGDLAIEGARHVDRDRATGGTCEPHLLQLAPRREVLLEGQL